MSTGIEWTDETWNPVTGCTKVSPGCDHCYAERITNRFGGPVAFDTVVLHPERLEQPLRWRKPRRVFVNSMSDLFHDDVPDEFIARVFAVMGLSPQHTYQVLTKRQGRMRALLSADRFLDAVGAAGWALDPYGALIYDTHHPWPFRNVWLGVSVEDQKRADLRIPALLDTPAAVRFVSAEPLLGPVDLRAHLDRMEYEGDDGTAAIYHSRLNWVIVGGESGPRARPMHPDWARDLRDQCQAAGVPFFFKQWGEWVPDIGDGSPRRVGKRQAGRLLDGRIWDEYPVGEGARAGSGEPEGSVVRA